MTFYQLFNEVDRILRSISQFDITDFHLKRQVQRSDGIGAALPTRLFGLKRVLWTYKPPDLVELQFTQASAGDM